MRFTLEIDVGNDAFYDADGKPNPDPELARILRNAAAKVEQGFVQSPLVDINGNTVGSYAFRGARPLRRRHGP